MANRILVGTDRGAFTYDRDANGTWQFGGHLLPGWRVDSVVQLASGRMVAGAGHYAYGATMRYSEDDGATWTQAGRTPSFEDGPMPTLADGTTRKLDAIWTIATGGPAQPGVI